MKELGIDYNEGIIIQLSFEEKQNLKQKIEKALNLSTSDEFQSLGFESQRNVISSIRYNLSESDVTLSKNLD